MSETGITEARVNELNKLVDFCKTLENKGFTIEPKLYMYVLERMGKLGVTLTGASAG